jgi:hypothetical protein
MADDLDRRLRRLDDMPAPDLWPRVGTEPGRPPVRVSPVRRVAVAVTALALATAAFAFLATTFRGGQSDTASSPGPSGVVTEPTARLLVQEGGPSGDAALLSGPLAVRHGCVGVAEGDSFTYLIWPVGSSLVEVDAGLAVTDGAGAVVASIGDTIRMGGGVNFLPRAEEAVVGGIPPACQEPGEHYWYVGVIEDVQPTPSASVDTPPCAGANDSVPNLPTVDPQSGSVGSTVSIRIPISYVGQAGQEVGFDGTADVWWNISWNTWEEVLTKEGPTPVVAGSSPAKLLSIPSDNTCELDGTFTVPSDAKPGRYPVIVVGVSSDGASALSGPELSFVVTA